MSPPPAADEGAQDPAARFKDVEEAVDKSRTRVHSASTLDDFDRSTIAKIVMYVYAGVIAAGFVLFIARACGAVYSRDDDWRGIMTDAGDLIKTAVLPIVTLVLGYYFGKSGKS